MAITEPIGELADVAAVALGLSPQPAVRSKYPVILVDLLHSCFAKTQFRHAFESNLDRPRQTGPSDIQKYKVMAIAPRIDQQMVVLLWPLHLTLIDVIPSSCTAFIEN